MICMSEVNSSTANYFDISYELHFSPRKDTATQSTAHQDQKLLRLKNFSVTDPKADEDI